jgi:hypothetical protein
VIDNGHPFIVAISSHGAPVQLLAGLVSRILAEVGAEPGAWLFLANAVSEAAGIASGAVAAVAAVAIDGPCPGSSGPGSGRCQVEFCAADGSLDVVVSVNGRRLLQASRPLLSRTDDAPL